MRREIRVLLPQASQIYDAANTRIERGAREILCAQPILRLEALPARTAHRVDQVVGGVHTSERRP